MHALGWGANSILDGDSDEAVVVRVDDFCEIVVRLAGAVSTAI